MIRAPEAAHQNPSKEEVEGLIHRYTSNLMRAAFSLGFAEIEAEELTQATFVAYLEGGARYQKRSQILTYLFGILYNKAREARRFRARHDTMDAAIDEAFDGHFDPQEHWNKPSQESMTEVEKTVQSAHIGVLLKECLEDLSAVMRMAFTLKEVEGLESEKICLALGLTQTNLGVILFRARNKLRECLLLKGAAIA